MESSSFQSTQPLDDPADIIANNENCNCTSTTNTNTNTSTNTSSSNKSKTNSQRVIPLTKEIINAMMDFNGSQSSTSISDKPFYNTFSITSLVREEVQNILHELSITDQFIRKEEIDILIERCLREKVTVDQQDSKTTTASDESDNNQEIEVTVEMLNESDKNKLIVENFQILEQRITNLEERISTMLQTVPKLRHLQAKKFKINTDVIREELRQFMDRMELGTNAKGSGMEALPKPQQEVEPIEQNGDGKNAIAVNVPADVNPYDDLYYEQRQNALNLLNYKKSKATMELNQRPCLNPHIRPLTPTMKLAKQTDIKPKQKSMFIYNNV